MMKWSRDRERWTLGRDLTTAHSPAVSWTLLRLTKYLRGIEPAGVEIYIHHGASLSCS